MFFRNCLGGQGRFDGRFARRFARRIARKLVREERGGLAPQITIGPRSPRPIQTTTGPLGNSDSNVTHARHPINSLLGNTLRNC